MKLKVALVEWRNGFVEIKGRGFLMLIKNQPVFICPADLNRVPAPGASLEGEELSRFVRRTAEDIAERLKLRGKTKS